MMDLLQNFVDDKSNVGKEFVSTCGKKYIVSNIDNFAYTDPIDNSITTKQVIVDVLTSFYIIPKNSSLSIQVICFLIINFPGNQNIF